MQDIYHLIDHEVRTMKKIIITFLTLFTLLIAGVAATSAEESKIDLATIDYSNLDDLGTFKVVSGKIRKLSPEDLPRGIDKKYVYEQPGIVLDAQGHYVKTVYFYSEDYSPSTGVGSMHTYGVK